jgi:hypothetical protein
VIDWGSGVWYLSAPFASDPSNSVSFNGSGPTSGGFGLLTPRKLVQVDAFNGGSSGTTVTLSCPGQPNVSFNLAAHTQATLVTNWTGTCNTVTIQSTNGWDTNFDNFVLQ